MDERQREAVAKVRTVLRHDCNTERTVAQLLQSVNENFLVLARYRKPFAHAHSVFMFAAIRYIERVNRRNTLVLSFL